MVGPPRADGAAREGVEHLRHSRDGGSSSNGVLPSRKATLPRRRSAGIDFGGAGGIPGGAGPAARSAARSGTGTTTCARVSGAPGARAVTSRQRRSVRKAASRRRSISAPRRAARDRPPPAFHGMFPAVVFAIAPLPGGPGEPSAPPRDACLAAASTGGAGRHQSSWPSFGGVSRAFRRSRPWADSSPSGDSVPLPHT